MKTLRYDHTLQYDPEVEYLQICLNHIRKKFNGDWNAVDEDGKFGNLTKNAVSGYQRYADLVVDGVVGDKTWASIESMMDYTPMLNTSAPGKSSRYSGGSSHTSSSSSKNYSSSGKDEAPLYTPVPAYSPIGLSSGLSPEEKNTSSENDSNVFSNTAALGNFGTGAASTASSVAPSANVKPAASSAAKAVSKGATKLGGAFLGADIVMSGEIKPSHIISGTMLGVSGTGIGTIAAGVWFVADYGTMGFNRIVNGEWKGLGDIIDEAAEENLGKYGKLELYEGLY